MFLWEKKTKVWEKLKRKVIVDEKPKVGAIRLHHYLS